MTVSTEIDNEESYPHKTSSSSKSNLKDLSHIPCKFFKVGACTAGPSCPFSHTVHEPGQQKDVCAWFVKGNCKFGHKCPRAHVLPGQSMSMDRKNKKAAQLAANGGVPPTPSRDSRSAKGAKREGHKSALQHANPSTDSSLLSGLTASTSARPLMAMTLKTTPSAPVPPIKNTDFRPFALPDDHNTRIPPSTTEAAKQQSDDDESPPSNAIPALLPRNLIPPTRLLNVPGAPRRPVGLSGSLLPHTPFHGSDVDERWTGVSNGANVDLSPPPTYAENMTLPINIPYRNTSPPFELHVDPIDPPLTIIDSSLPYSDGPIQVLPRIWIGSEHNARDWQSLRVRDISAILNVAKEVSSPFDASQPSSLFATTLLSTELPSLIPMIPSTYCLPDPRSGRPAMHYLKLNWTHGQRDLVTHGFPPAMRFVDAALQRDQSILIHCQSGVFRAAALVIAIVMRVAATRSSNVPPHIWRLKGMQAAYAYVKGKSQHVDLDMSLVQQLLDYECELWGGPVFPVASDQASSDSNENWVTGSDASTNEDECRSTLASSWRRRAPSFHQQLLDYECELRWSSVFPMGSDQASSDSDEDWVTDSDASTNEEDECSTVQQQASTLGQRELRSHSFLPTEVSVRVSPLSANFPRPPDLTPHISKANDQYVAGGGFGDVYRCWYKDGSPKEVAVKAFRFKFALEEDASERLNKMVRRELGIWRRLDHKNIVPFLGIAYGFGMHGAMSLVSSWMPNESLHHFLAKDDANLALGHRLQLLLDVATGLHYLHSFPIVHGDLNCNNVLLDADYTARLADFGFASLVGEIPEGLSYMQRSTARPGALRWIAPEQVEAEESFTRTPKSDIYSFGCVLSGKQPWSEVREDSAVVLRLAKGQRPGRPTSRAIDDLHWGLIQRCWSPMVERPTAEAIISAIERFLSCCPASLPLCEALLAWSDASSSQKEVC